jgi:hypothetical protein
LRNGDITAWAALMLLIRWFGLVWFGDTVTRVHSWNLSVPSGVVYVLAVNKSTVNLATNYMFTIITISPKELREVAWLLLNGNLL